MENTQSSPPGSGIVLLFTFLILSFVSLACRPQKPPVKSVETSQDHKGITWHQWSHETVEKARQKTRPLCIYLYTPWSYWCGEIERRYFKDQKIINFFENNFIAVKASTLDFPELQAAYTSRGVPSLLFFTSQGDYFARFDGLQNQKAFTSFLQKVLSLSKKPRQVARRRSLWKKRRQAGEKRLHSLYLAPKNLAPLPGELQSVLKDSFDTYFGGFGKGAKLFHFPVYHFMLYTFLQEGNSEWVERVQKTLYQIEISHLYDRLQGGFHRLGANRNWGEPYFEKLLATNAEMISAYSSLYLTAPDPTYREMIEETIRFIRKSLKSERGYWVGLDSGSKKGDFGRTYVWSPSDLDELFDKKTSQILQLYYGLSPEQNSTKGPRPLGITMSYFEIAQKMKMESREVREVIKKGKKIMAQARKKRKAPPAIKRETLSSTALAARAFFWAYRALDKREYLDEGLKLVKRLESYRHSSGAYSHRKGRFLTRDQSEVALALWEAYSLTGEAKWLERGKKALEELIAKASHSKEYGGLMYGWGKGGVVGRPLRILNFYANGRAALALMIYHHQMGEKEFAQEARKIFQLLGSIHTNFGQRAASFDLALSLYLKNPLVVYLPSKSGFPIRRLARKSAYPVVVKTLSPGRLKRKMGQKYRPGAAYMKRGKKLTTLTSKKDFHSWWQKFHQKK